MDSSGGSPSPVQPMIRKRTKQPNETRICGVRVSCKVSVRLMMEAAHAIAGIRTRASPAPAALTFAKCACHGICSSRSTVLQQTGLWFGKVPHKPARMRSNAASLRKDHEEPGSPICGKYQCAILWYGLINSPGGVEDANRNKGHRY